jgi:hypothetical protein
MFLAFSYNGGMTFFWNFQRSATIALATDGSFCWISTFTLTDSFLKF